MNFLLSIGQFQQNIQLAHMIKNRTLEFKQKYATSQPKQPPVRNTTPEYLKNKFIATGFTDFSVTTSAKQTSSRKLAKVESTAFINSRKKLSEFCLQAETYSRKYLDNSTSLCQYLNSQEKKMEKTPMSRYKIIPNEDALSQNATIQSPKLHTPHRIPHNPKPLKNQIIISPVANITSFFNSLTPRSLFFCCKCLKYIFAIQKNLHFPKCQGQINFNELNQKQMEQLGWQRLQLLKQLSEYTNFKQIQIGQLYDRFKKKELKEEVLVETGVEYLAFQKIKEAFYLVYYLLLSKQSVKNSGIFSMKKIFSCSEPNQNSGLYEKKYFG